MESLAAVIDYGPEQTAYNSYYVFGMTMPDGGTQELSYSASSYRYGFNGMEIISEWTGSSSHLDFGARCYDSRAARFNSLDNYSGKFSYQSPYLISGNSPIIATDIHGDSIFIVSGNNAIYYAYDALLETELGAEVIEKYQNSSIDHIFITIADDEDADGFGSAGGGTLYQAQNLYFSLNAEDFGKLPDKETIRGIRGIGVLANFGGLDLKDYLGDDIEEMNVSFIALNPDYFGESTAKWKVRGQAEALFHEIKAHIEDASEFTTMDDEHDLYGTKTSLGFGQGDTPEPDSPAEEIWEQLDEISKPVKGAYDEIDHTNVNQIANPSTKPEEE